MKSNREFLKAYGWSERDRTGTDMTRGVPPPLPRKPIPGDAVPIDLMNPEKLKTGGMPLIETLRQRKSRRRYTKDPLTLEELSFLLWSTQGLRDQEDNGDIRKRTVPSGGARHPFETYLVVNRITVLEPGLYRYLPVQHQIFLLYADERLPELVSEGTRGQAFVGSGAVVFIWTAVPYRGEWRYGNVAHKMIAIDAGHVCQNLYLAAESIGSGTCAIAAYDQDKMDALLGVDGKDEFVIYAAPVGKIS